MEKGNLYTNQYMVAEKIYKGFIDIFDDNNPLHTDESFAKEHGMPQVVMHGNILNGFVSHFVGEILPQKNVIIHSQSINFYKPVFLNDTVTLSAELAEVYESVKTYIFKFTFKNQEGVRVAKGTVQIGLI